MSVFSNLTIRHLRKLCQEYGINPAKSKDVMVSRLDEAKLNCNQDIVKKLVIDGKEELQKLLEIWSESKAKERINKRKICLYLHTKIVTDNDAEFEKTFKDQYEDILILYYGKCRFPDDKCLSFFFDNIKKQNIRKTIKKEIILTLMVLRKKLKCDLQKVFESLLEDNFF